MSVIQGNDSSSKRRTRSYRTPLDDKKWNRLNRAYRSVCGSKGIVYNRFTIIIDRKRLLTPVFCEDVPVIPAYQRGHDVAGDAPVWPSSSQLDEKLPLLEEVFGYPS